MPSPPSAGYSGTPLPKKLGIREGARVVLLDAPEKIERTLGELPPGVELRRDLRAGNIDVVLLFATSERALRRRFAPAQKKLATAGGLWVAWPKQASGVETDLSDGVVRAFGLSTGLVDNKVCAVDGTWSGLRFVKRVKDR